MEEKGLTKEHPYNHYIQLLCFISFAFIWVIDSFFLHFLAEISFIFPLILRIPIFLTILTFAVILGYSSHKILFNDKKKEDKLITTGVFGYVRHPLYVSVILTYFSFIVLSMSFVSFIPWFMTWVMYNYLASYEEKELEKLLGKKYLTYKKNIPRWLIGLSLIKVKKPKK